MPLRAVDEEPVFDFAGHDVHHPQQGRVVPFAVAAEVKDCEQFAVRIKYRGSGTVEHVVYIEVMFFAHDCQRFLLDDDGASGIGAPHLLGPASPSMHLDFFRIFQEYRIAFAVEDVARCVTEDDNRV